jgi:hypothetical protein
MGNEYNKKPFVVNDVLKELDRDVLDMPADLLHRELAQHGLSYGTVTAGGKSFVQGLLRARKRTAWMKRADADSQRMTRKLAYSAEWIRKRAQELMAQGNPEIQAAFRDRQPGDMTDEDLRSLAEEQAIVELLEEDENV